VLANPGNMISNVNAGLYHGSGIGQLTMLNWNQHQYGLQQFGCISWPTRYNKARLFMAGARFDQFHRTRDLRKAGRSSRSWPLTGIAVGIAAFSMPGSAAVLCLSQEFQVQHRIDRNGSGAWIVTAGDDQ